MSTNNIYLKDCSTCINHCDGISKDVYLFEKDADFSEKFEQGIINIINKKNIYIAEKTTEPGFPDIAVYRNKNSAPVYFIEVKVQQRTFMSVKKALPLSDLSPSETIALNLSDLIRYFDIQDKTGVDIYILWVLLNRPCLVDRNKKRFFYQSVDVLKEIFNLQKENRRFRRKSGDGDVVDGVHKGVTVNYHFSLNELLEWEI